MPENACETAMVSDIDSSECEREAIHLPGSIQSVGVLIALMSPLTVRRSAPMLENAGVEPAAPSVPLIKHERAGGVVRTASTCTHSMIVPLSGTITVSGAELQICAPTKRVRAASWSLSFPNVR